MMDVKNDCHVMQSELDMSMAVSCDRAAKITDFSINFVSDNSNDTVVYLSTSASSKWNPTGFDVEFDTSSARSK